jgi:hypothetical protein
MLKEDQIFIHVPKTGGTTLNCALHSSDQPQAASFNFRHIVRETKRSNSGDIFNPLKREKYEQYKIFMMLRHPLDRIVSEYYFIKERDEFFSLLKPAPPNFKEYALHRQTANYVVSFLLGNRIYASQRPTEEDLQLVINEIEQLNFTIGIFEQFNSSLALFKNEVGVQWPKSIENKRVTIIRPEKEEISADLTAKILKKHALDVRLYEFALKRFSNYEVSKDSLVRFKDNRYQYVLTYTNNHNLLELVLKNHPFIGHHKMYFNELQRFLSTTSVSSGEEYLIQWKLGFMNALKENKLSKDMSDLLARHEETLPINFIQAFGRYIDKANPRVWKDITLVFQRQQIPQNGWISSVFKRFGL